METRKIAFWQEINRTISQVSTNYDQQWQKRKRVINSRFLVLFIFKLVLSKNSQGYKTTLEGLWHDYAEKGIMPPQAFALSSSSLCEARKKLSADIFKSINDHLLDNTPSSYEIPLWNGHRVFAVDGSKINLPRELLNYGYKSDDEKRRYYPQGLLSTLYNVHSGLIYDVTLTNYTNERLCAQEHTEALQAGDIILLDRGYFCYWLLYECVERKIYPVFRMQSGTINGEIQAFWDSKDMDAVIDYIPSAPVISKLKKTGFDRPVKPIKIRLVKPIIEGEIHLYVTTLFGEKYPTASLGRLYALRWDIEELYKVVKRFIEATDFHARTENGVKQAIYANFILINLARFLELDSQPLLPKTNKSDEPNGLQSFIETGNRSVSKPKINFKHCLTMMGKYLHELVFDIAKFIDSCYNRLLQSITRIRQKIRPGRNYPRVSRKPWSKWQKTRKNTLCPA